MAAPAPRHTHLTDDEYFALELGSKDKHQLWSGEVFAMAGGSFAHNVITTNVAATLRASLRGGPYRVSSPDQRIAIGPEGTYLYPDAVVVCGNPEFGKHATLRNPALVVEVLSESTESFDRGEKFDAYAKLPSLMHVVFVSARQRRVEHFERQPDGVTWRMRAAGGTETLTIASPAVSLPLDEVYLDADALVATEAAEHRLRTSE